ncbi:hypothetical protein MVEN_00090400 [Mycena venus]|uniref:Uncharacterized protein n=1 Tax=Mycena venus TaxID=2733690 RepID=A0A8H6Z7I2_9AGAR|nr:hypothetical protein MVEN_00090400 [Mycena venus]
MIFGRWELYEHGSAYGNAISWLYHAIRVCLSIHPIIADYDGWMAEGPQLKRVKHAQKFVHRFSSIRLLPGDTSLIEPHVSHAHQALTASLLDDSSSVSESLHLRATVLSSILFQLVILRTYLHRSSQDDLQIYFLAYRFTPTELQNLSADDPFAAAKKGGVIRHSTVPEIVLQTPENDHEGMPTPLRWCKMRTVLRKTAAARIPAGFVLATAYLNGQEYNWNSMGSPTVLQSRLTAEDIEIGAIGCKRKREEDPEEEGGPRVNPAEMVNAGVGVRRST